MLFLEFIIGSWGTAACEILQWCPVCVCVCCSLIITMVILGLDKVGVRVRHLLVIDKHCVCVIMKSHFHANMRHTQTITV